MQPPHVQNNADYNIFTVVNQTSVEIREPFIDFVSTKSKLQRKPLKLFNKHIAVLETDGFGSFTLWIGQSCINLALKTRLLE